MSHLSGKYSRENRTHLCFNGNVIKCLGEIVKVSALAIRCALLHEQLRIRRSQLFRNVVAGADGIQPDSKRKALVAYGLGEAENRMLGRCVLFSGCEYQRSAIF